MTEPVCSSKQQGSRVAAELEALKQKKLARTRRESLQELSQAPLTTPEEAHAFLAAMRDKQHERISNVHHTAHANADGVDGWFYKQRQNEQELRQKRKEAEAMLRSYRGGRTSFGGASIGSLHPHEGDLKVPSQLQLQLQSQQHPHGENHHHHHQYPHYDDDDRWTPTHDQVHDVHDDDDDEEEEDDPTVVRTDFDYSRQPFSVWNNNDEVVRPSFGGFSTISSVGRDSYENHHEEEKKMQDEDHHHHPSKDHHHQHNHQHNQHHSRRSEPVSQPQQSKVPEIVERPITVWRHFVSRMPDSMFQPEKGRYHLYLSYACPGSHRVLIVRALKGLEDVISVTFVHPTWRLTNPFDENDKHRGWVFGDPHGVPFQNTIGRGGPFPPAYPGNDPDPHFGAFSIRDIYQEANDTSGKYTIPLLWDRKLGTIVNNESSDIAYMLNSSFNALCRHPEVDLYTEHDDAAAQRLEKVNEWMAPLMIHGVYRCGFAKTQRAYDKAIAELCRAFDQADDLLATQRYLTGNDSITDADIRLFVSLLRFDEVYAFYFRANARLVMLTPNLLNFCRDIYQLPGVAETCNMEQIKAHFYGSHAEWNKYSVIPRGLGFIELLALPHDRERFVNGDQYQGHDLPPNYRAFPESPSAALYFDDLSEENEV